MQFRVFAMGYEARVQGEGEGVERRKKTKNETLTNSISQLSFVSLFFSFPSFCRSLLPQLRSRIPTFAPSIQQSAAPWAPADTPKLPLRQSWPRAALRAPET